MNSDDTAEAAIRVLTRAGAPWIMLRGHVNVGAAAELHQAALLLLGAEEEITVSCQHVDHLDASILQVLFAMKEERRAQGKMVRLIDVTPAVRSFIRLAGLAEVLLDTPCAEAV